VGNGSEFKEWLSIALQCLSLLAILFSAIKIINRNEREWIVREQRLLEIESDLKRIDSELASFRPIMAQMAAISVKLAEVTAEMERIRNRLDRFLDTQSGSRGEK